LTQKIAAELAAETHVILLAGRYEGVDARVGEKLAGDMVSIGDYVVTGGELPALVVTDAVTRLLPGVLGAEGAAGRESFADGLLEPPQYTRPEDYQGARVPPVLLSGDHARIARWRRVQAIWLTWRERAGLAGDSAADGRRAPAGGTIRARGDAGAARRPRVAGLGPRRSRRSSRGWGPADRGELMKGLRAWTRFDWSRRCSSRRTARDSPPATRSACT
jgi:hypothetical protein